MHPAFATLKDEILDVNESAIYALKAASEIAATPKPQVYYLLSVKQFRTIILANVIQGEIGNPAHPLALENGAPPARLVEKFDYWVN